MEAFADQSPKSHLFVLRFDLYVPAPEGDAVPNSPILRAAEDLKPASQSNIGIGIYTRRRCESKPSPLYPAGPLISC